MREKQSPVFAKQDTGFGEIPIKNLQEQRNNIVLSVNNNNKRGSGSSSYDLKVTDERTKRRSESE